MSLKQNIFQFPTLERAEEPFVYYSGFYCQPGFQQAIGNLPAAQKQECPLETLMKSLYKIADCFTVSRLGEPRSYIATDGEINFEQILPSGFNVWIRLDGTACYQYSGQSDPEAQLVREFTEHSIRLFQLLSTTWYSLTPARIVNNRCLNQPLVDVAAAFDLVAYYAMLKDVQQTFQQELEAYIEMARVTREVEAMNMPLIAYYQELDRSLRDNFGQLGWYATFKRKHPFLAIFYSEVSLKRNMQEVNRLQHQLRSCLANGLVENDQFQTLQDFEHHCQQQDTALHQLYDHITVIVNLVKTLNRIHNAVVMQPVMLVPDCFNGEEAQEIVKFWEIETGKIMPTVANPLGEVQPVRFGNTQRVDEPFRAVTKISRNMFAGYESSPSKEWDKSLFRQSEELVSLFAEAETALKACKLL